MNKIYRNSETSAHVHREPMTSDVIFKAVFGQDTEDSKAALIELLNVVLDRKDDPIINIVYKNPFSIAEALTEKVIIMDIKVETDKDEVIDIEMQIGELDEYISRSLYYGCNQLAKSLDKGDTYDKIKKSIVISFIKTRVFPQEYPVHTVFTMHENDMGAQLTDLLELHYIELGKIDCAGRDPEQLSPLEQIGAYLKYSGSEEDSGFVEALVQKGAKVISMTDKVLKKVSEEERMQYLRESRQMAEMQISWEKQAAQEKGFAKGHSEGLEKGLEKGLAEGRAEGLAEGRAEGHAEGRREANKENAQKMKAMGLSVAQIREITDLSEDEIERL